jgi:ribosome recycling factor
MAVDDILLECEERMEKTADHLKSELRSIRTGRASTAIVEHIKVDYYGVPTDLKAIAALNVPEPTQILIRPFSPKDIKAIEKAINDSQIGLTPHSDGRQIRLQLPALSQERRLQLVGQCKKFAEEVKIQIRNVRRDANKLAEVEEKETTITEDEAKGCKEQIQELTKVYEAKVDEMIELKQKEVMTI